MGYYVQTNGIQPHYLDYSGVTQPLLLVPGLTANCYCFEAIVRAGLAPRVRMLAPDMRGRGGSATPAHDYSLAAHAADVIGMLDTLGIRQVVLGGHSFGGLLSLHIAAHYPARVSQLVLIDAVIASADPKTRELIQPALARLGQAYPSFDQFLQTIRAAPYYHGWGWDALLESYYRADIVQLDDGSARARVQPEHIAEVMDSVIAEPWRDYIRSIQHPTLLLHAPSAYGPPGSSPIVSLDQAQEMLSLLANVRYITVPGNHQTMLYGSGAQVIAQAISEFILETS